MYNLSHIHRELGEIRIEIRALTEAVSKATATEEKRLDNHSGRIADLEKSRARWNGGFKVVGVMTTLGGAVWGWLRLMGSG